MATGENDLTIRQYETAHRVTLTRLWSAVFADDPPWNAPDLMIDNKMRVQPDLLIVAVLNNVVVGAVMAGYDGVRGWINHLTVAHESRRRGIATQLVRAAENGLRKLGCPKVNLQIRPTNPEVLASYKTLGYHIEERVSMGRFIEGAG